jgi:hypothetical protein
LLHNSFAVFAIILAHLEVVEVFIPSVISFSFRLKASIPPQLTMKLKVTTLTRYQS